jgi:hypothetical protein
MTGFEPVWIAPLVAKASASAVPPHPDRLSVFVRYETGGATPVRSPVLGRAARKLEQTSRRARNLVKAAASFHPHSLVFGPEHTLRSKVFVRHGPRFDERRQITRIITDRVARQRDIARAALAPTPTGQCTRSETEDSSGLRFRNQRGFLVHCSTFSARASAPVRFNYRSSPGHPRC